jgi:hypothetical protein
MAYSHVNPCLTSFTRLAFLRAARSNGCRGNAPHRRALLNEEPIAPTDGVDAVLRHASQALERTLATIARSRQLLEASGTVLDEVRAALPHEPLAVDEIADEPACGTAG